MGILNEKNIIRPTVIVAVAVAVIIAAGWFFFSLDPVNATAGSATTSPIVFQVNAGDGFREVAQNLYAVRLIRSPLAFVRFVRDVQTSLGVLASTATLLASGGGTAK